MNNKQTQVVIISDMMTCELWNVRMESFYKAVVLHLLTNKLHIFA